MKTAVAAGLALAAVFVLLACLLPWLAVDSLYRETSGLIEGAKLDALSGDFGSAYEKSALVLEKVKRREHRLMLFYDHGDIAELTGGIDTALDLAKEGDAGLLLAALGDAENMFEYLIGINEISIFNLL